MVAELARDAGALTVAVVTKPFTFEGAGRREIAERAHDELIDKVDTIITIPNDRVLQIVDKKTSLLEAFDTVDDVLRQGVQGISELITIPGLINVDFADVKAIMSHSGSALMGIGRAQGENRASEAAKAAVASPLLDISIDGAKGVLFTVSGGTSMSMHEVNEAAKLITGNADPSAKVIFGAVLDEGLKDEMKVTVIATGFMPSNQPSPFVGMRSVSAAPPPSRYTPTSPKPFRKEEKQAAKTFEVKPLKREEAKAAPVKAAAPTDDEDLEIPAFIRRKLGS